ncbi:MAG TPA: HPF/RaiA family ribosome-associated protein [Bacteroidales bacterium]|nr:HPF/RaiA family ribosome-associated protein [Bacteroidales bacterium]
MLIQFRSNNIPLSEGLRASLSGFVLKSLKRYKENIIRIEVHLEDENSDKTGKNDKRCSIEVRPANLKPIIATSKSDNLIQAVREAADKSKASLDKTIGRISDRKYYSDDGI